MKVLGYSVSPELEAACLERMRSGWFSAAQLTDVVERVGGFAGYCPTAYRIAGNLIQRERKAGHIVRAGKGWFWK